MKTTAFVIAATAALVSSQGVILDPATGKYKCPRPNAAYCAGDSLKTDIIIRCDKNGIGQPGRCTDNLAGEPPQGLKTALCYEKDAESGTAACEKNCVVYGGSGNGNGTFTLPAALCTPSFTASVTSTSTYAPTSKPTSTGSSYPSTTLTTVTSGVTTTSCPSTSKGTAGPSGSTYPGGPSGTHPGGNGTCTTCGGGSGPTTYPPTNTPPTSTRPTGPSSVPTAGASANRAGGALAAVGLMAAYFL